jgi:hypothetical protein
MAKIVKIGPVKGTKKIPLHRNRDYIDALKDQMLKEHNQKIRKQ